jgi:hypothetical protein
MSFLTGKETYSETMESGDGSVWSEPKHVTYRAESDGLDLNATETALLRAAAVQGLDLDRLLIAAGHLFSDDVIFPASACPTESDLANLVDDELRAPAD